MKMAICGIVKNEQPYILEWIAFHRLIGFEKFILADNISNDGTSELLSKLDNAGIIDRIIYPTQAGQPPQIPAYREIYKLYKEDINYIAFLDADEFITSTQDISLKKLLKELEKKDKFGGLALNWSVFGSSGKKYFDEGLVIERFTKRANKDQFINHHLKSIVKIECIESISNCHQAQLKDGFLYYNTNYEIIDKNKQKIFGLSEKVCWSKFKVNHYMIKSYQEFKEKKQARGRGASLLKRDDSFFYKHDFNEIEEAEFTDIIPRVNKEIFKLKEIADLN